MWRGVTRWVKGGRERGVRRLEKGSELRAGREVSGLREREWDEKEAGDKTSERRGREGKTSGDRRVRENRGENGQRRN